MKRVVVYAAFILLVAQLVAAPTPTPMHATIDLVKAPKGMTIETYRAQQIRSLQSRLILAAVLNKKGEFGERMAALSVLKEQKAPLAWLEKHLRVEPVGKTAMRVSLSAGSRKDQVAIINAAVKTYLVFGPPSRRGSLLSKIEKGRQVRLFLIEGLASREAHLAEVNQKVPKNEAEAAGIASNRAQAIKNADQRKEEIKEFDAGQKTLQTKLGNAAAEPVVQWAREPGSRSGDGSSDPFSDPSAKHREKTDDSPKSWEK